MNQQVRDFVARGDAERHIFNELLTRHISSKVIKPGDSVLDLGANEGFHAKEFSRLVGDQGKVHAFEPNPELWSDLSAIPNVRLWPYAVGSRTSVETFFLPIGHHQVGSLVDARDFMGQDTPMKMLSVVLASVDSLPEAIEKPITFVKIDIERYEEQAMRGAAITLMRDKPIIIYENHTQGIGELLGSMGFQIFHMLHDIDPDLEMPNVVAVHKDSGWTTPHFLPQQHEVDRIVLGAANYGL